MYTAYVINCTPLSPLISPPPPLPLRYRCRAPGSPHDLAGGTAFRVLVDGYVIGGAPSGKGNDHVSEQLIKWDHQIGVFEYYHPLGPLLMNPWHAVSRGGGEVRAFINVYVW